MKSNPIHEIIQQKLAQTQDKIGKTKAIVRKTQEILKILNFR